MKNFHAIEVKYNNTSFTLKSYRFNQSLRVGKKYEYGRYIDQAIEHLTALGFNVIGKAEIGEKDIIITDSFRPLKYDYEALYLQYFNDFLTVEKFAEYNDFTVEFANDVIEKGRQINKIREKDVQQL